MTIIFVDREKSSEGERYLGDEEPVTLITCTNCNGTGKDPKKRKRRCPDCAGCGKQRDLGEEAS